jgi:lycopene cyclase CruP
MTLTEHMLSGVPGNPLMGLAKADERWNLCRSRSGGEGVQTVVEEVDAPLEDVDWDVVICGGTLGILLGAALVQRGWRVALVERGVLRGREQEWNISRQELSTMSELGLLSSEDIDGVIASSYNPARLQFGEGNPIWVRDVLNVGVDPVGLLERLKAKFLQWGGQLFEQAAFEGAWVHPNGVLVKADRPLNTRLLVDAMGHFSPMARQVRDGQRPDGVCLVVGTCATGYGQNDSGDLMVSFTPVAHQCQYFWEAFPAKDGRTTYLFTYLDAEPERFSLTDLFEDYWRLLPDYQQVTLEQLQVKRALFGFFPCYRQSPLQYPWGRTLAVGDSSGSQSPLSFGGFGAMVRHLPRLVHGLDEALAADCLGGRALARLQPYQPNLSVTWLFQRSMSVGVGQTVQDQQINQLLATIFDDMAGLGDATLRPFLQDVVQFGPLTKALLVTTVKHPALVAKIIPQVGVPALVAWLGHYLRLAGYSATQPLARTMEPIYRLLPPVQRYYSHRWLDALTYGSGKDHNK